MSTTTAKRRPAKNTDHVVVGSGLRLTCLHCGERTAAIDPAVGIEIGAMATAGKAFERRHANCPAPASPRCPFCLELGHTAEEHTARIKTAEEWLSSGDTGISSRAIWFHMMGLEPAGEDRMWGPGNPHDPADFGRCHRLLKRFPAWRARIAEMAKYAGWARLAEAWDELEGLYVEEIKNSSGMAPRLYARMKALRGES